MSEGCYHSLNMTTTELGVGALQQGVFKLNPVTDSGQSAGKKIWTLTFDSPGQKVNKLGRDAMGDIEALLPELEKRGNAGEIDALVLVSGKPGNFIAGADIELIRSAKTADAAAALSRTGQKLLDRWEDLSFPTVVAIDGAAMGGGCEFSLASTAIVMSNSSAARIGLPEVLLGLIPGMGGCVRLPRKVGLATALDMILTGKTLSGERAASAGLAEACLPKEDFLGNVNRWVVRNLDALQEGRKLGRKPKLGGMGGPVGSILESALGRGIVFKKAREGVLSKTHGHYPAPLEAIAVIQETGGAYGDRVRGSERDWAMERESKGFGKVAATDVSKNLIRIFFLTEEVKKSKGIAGDTVTRKVERGAVLGAGVMGGGIAQLFAEKSIPVRMKDINTKALALGVQAASKIFAGQVKKRRINRRQFAQKMNLISPVLDFSGFRSADIVVEAVIENMEIKQKVFKELEGQVADTCVLASNTSSLSISKMQSVLSKPERFAGMHFFNPVHKMPLVEVIRGDRSSDEAVSAVFQLSKQLGKTPIVVKDAPGFLVNRLLAPYLNEATYLLADGVPITRIDELLVKFGMPMGPMELIDEVGVDVAEKVAHILHDAFGERMSPAHLNAKLVEAKRLGKKSNKGLYTYDGRKKFLDEEIYSLLGVTPNSSAVKDEQVVDRCILPMINEAARCLEEKIVERPEDVDLGMIMGTGFPPFRGGLLRYADTLGAREIVDRLKKYQATMGARFAPSEAILKLASGSNRFYPQGEA